MPSADVVSATVATTSPSGTAPGESAQRRSSPVVGVELSPPATARWRVVEANQTREPPSGSADSPATVPGPAARRRSSLPSGRAERQLRHRVPAAQHGEAPVRPAARRPRAPPPGPRARRSPSPAASAGSATAQPAARGVAVGEQPQAAVARHPRRAAGVDADLHLDRRRAGVEVEQPDVVARRRAGAGRDEQPPAVRRDRAAVVVGRVQALAPDQDVLRRVGVPTTCRQTRRWNGRLARGHLVGRQPPDVEQGLAARHPRDGGVAAAVDRTVEQRAGRDVEHVQQRLLVAAGRTAGRPAGSPSFDGDQASRVVAPDGSTALGSSSTRSVPSASRVSSTACS